MRTNQIQRKSMSSDPTGERCNLHQEARRKMNTLSDHGEASYQGTWAAGWSMRARRTGALIAASAGAVAIVFAREEADVAISYLSEDTRTPARLNVLSPKPVARPSSFPATSAVVHRLRGRSPESDRCARRCRHLCEQRCLPADLRKIRGYFR